ncbi:Glycosyltransferase involved in cell wall bisynthesis [Paraburkholderia fungorum]|uniref:Glycosyltransferase involved in cell wall bisynthesis n=1 Tax=Paraburkholderia fungorum TaxID=134537 RepID=A0A1H0ZZI1_9BURK|nr:glycosyltransferase family 4 protein [Paraburkholderia fungorum]SDQ32799.1 Glycosyltransferase involved in cell wall bisynthesis [Paraburkholderia fungorum]
MSGLKFILTTYSTAFAVSGGGESELVQVAEILKASGVHIDIYGIGSRPLNFYDGVIHFSVNSDGHAILREAAVRNKRIFLWPNVWWLGPVPASEVERIQEMTRIAHKLLFKSRAELENFTQYIQVPEDKIEVLPTCVSNRFLAQPDLDLLSTVSNSTEFALGLGLIEPIKNQLQTIRALNEIGVDGLFVGGARDDDYFRQCVAEAHPGITFLPFVQPCSALLRSIIANCSVMVEPSIDPPGRSSLEAAIMQKPLVMSDGAWQREHFASDVWYAPTDSVSELASAIRHALTDADRDAKIAATYERVMSQHSASIIGPQIAALLARESL